MEKYQREIILIDQIHINRNQIFDKSGEVYFLDPKELFLILDWRLYEEDFRVMNAVYGELFDAVLINQKKLVCFWPMLNFPDDKWLELSSHCEDAKIKTKIIYSSGEEHDLPISIQETWKSFVLFLMESLCEDIKMNEYLEEIATLKCGNDSILLFKLEQNGFSKYSYVQSPENGFDFDNGDIQLKKNGINYVPLFSSFDQLLKKLMLEVDINCYQTSFFDKKLEKYFFNTILKNCASKNLIESWIKNYSLN